MKVTPLVLAGLLALVPTCFPVYGAESVIHFSGQVIDPSAHTTQITPTLQTDGTMVYVVTSTVTGRRLATLPTKEAAVQFAAQVNPAATYR